MYNKILNQNFEFVKAYYGFKNSINLFTSIVDISELTENNILDSFHPRARRHVKSTFRDDKLKCYINTNFDDFYPILIKNKKKFNMKPVHTLDELIQINYLYPDKNRLFMCYNENLPIAGIWVLETNHKSLLAFYIASMSEYNYKKPVNRLFYEVIKWAIINDKDILDLGVSMNTASDNPIEPAKSLINFKESVASRGFLRSTYELKL